MIDEYFNIDGIDMNQIVLNERYLPINLFL